VSPAAWNYSGVATGEVVFTIESPPAWGSDKPLRSTVRLACFLGCWLAGWLAGWMDGWRVHF